MSALWRYHGDETRDMLNCCAIKSEMLTADAAKRKQLS
jgi:hypothetical protein